MNTKNLTTNGQEEIIRGGFNSLTIEDLNLSEDLRFENAMFNLLEDLKVETILTNSQEIFNLTEDAKIEALLTNSQYEEEFVFLEDFYGHGNLNQSIKGLNKKLEEAKISKIADNMFNIIEDMKIEALLHKHIDRQLG